MHVHYYKQFFLFTSKVIPFTLSKEDKIHLKIVKKLVNSIMLTIKSHCKLENGEGNSQSRSTYNRSID